MKHSAKVLLVESSDCDLSPSSPLRQDSKVQVGKRYHKFVRNGDSFSPVGDVVLTDALQASAYSIDSTMEGLVFRRIQCLTDDVLRFENSPMDRVVEEVDRFWSRKEKFSRLGVLHSRGILLYGPPGTGKSICLQQVVESMVSRGDLVLFAKSTSAVVDGVRAVKEVEPERKVVVVFEEVDELCSYNERPLLQLLDGDLKVGNVLYLATTNYINKLPERMLRTGRFDHKVYIGYPTFEHRLKYFTVKLKGIEEDSSKITQLAEDSEGLGFSDMREMIVGLYAMGDTMDSVRSRIPQLKDSKKVKAGRQNKIVSDSASAISEALKFMKQR